jgi:hypothetical protein
MRGSGAKTARSRRSQWGRDTAAVKNAARGDYGDWRYGIDDLRDQGHRADLAAIAARLATLRDDYVDASFGRLDGLCDRGDLQHHPRADSVGLRHQIAGIAEREGDNPRSRPQRVAKYLRIQGLRSVVYRKWPIGERFYHIDVAFNGRGGPEQRSDAAQRALIGYRGREFSRRARPHRRHRRQDDGHQGCTVAAIASS